MFYIPANKRQTKEIFSKFLVAEIEYLRESGWVPFVNTGAKIKWKSPHTGDIHFQGVAVSQQREIDLGHNS